MVFCYGIEKKPQDLYGKDKPGKYQDIFPVILCSYALTYLVKILQIYTYIHICDQKKDRPSEREKKKTLLRESLRSEEWGEGSGEREDERSF
jgi:hypothetical protein